MRKWLQNDLFSIINALLVPRKMTPVTIRGNLQNRCSMRDIINGSNSPLLCTFYVISYLVIFAQYSSAYSVTVRTSKGTVEGYTLNEVSVFEGIPYAKPPVGERRFQAPEDPDEWQAPLQTKAFRPICPQLMTPFSAQMNIVGPFEEDCLYLNVYTPVVHGAGPGHSAPLLPVMVWIHGGGFIQGSASQTPAPGVVSNLASRQVVVVTLNYRLDILGFFSTDSEDVPDNVALLDQIAALKWVQREISHFGGNQNDVTLFGYSAGASSISAHLYSPLSKGLFSKAILQSGSSYAPWSWTHLEHNANLRISREAAKRLGCAGLNKWSKKEFRDILNCMKSVPADVLIEMSNEVCARLNLGWRLQVGGSEGFLPLPPLDMAYERRENIPVMIGTTRDETMLTAAPSVILYGHGYHNITRDLFSSAVENLVRVYYKEHEWNAARTVLLHEYGDGEFQISEMDSHAWLENTIQMQSGFSFFAPAILEAHTLLESQDAPVFLYSLDYVSNSFPWASPFKGVPHGQDMFYLFATAPGGLGWSFTKEEREIIDIFGKMWTNFAKSGNPNFPDALAHNWTSLSPKDHWSYLSIDLPTPRMSEHQYSWKAAHVFNRFLPRILASVQPRAKDETRFYSEPITEPVELRTNQFFISTWALLFTLIGVVLIILIFSICHWNTQATNWKDSKSKGSKQGFFATIAETASLTKKKKQQKVRSVENGLAGYYPPPQPMDPRAFYFGTPAASQFFPYTYNFNPFAYYQQQNVASTHHRQQQSRRKDWSNLKSANGHSNATKNDKPGGEKEKGTGASWAPEVPPKPAYKITAK